MSSGQHSASDTFRPTPSALWQVVLALAVFGTAFGAAAWRIDQAPDVFTDEILYTRTGVRVAGEGAMVWDSGRPVFVHPPLYFLAEAAYWRIAGARIPPLYAAGDIFASVYHARYLNALLAGLTAVLLYLSGRRLHGNGLGLFVAVLFALDPFGLRTNRRAMLETMAAFLTLAGMMIVLNHRADAGGRLSPSRAVVAGLLLGAGLLTKELTFTAVLAVLLFGLWELWRNRRTRRPEKGGPFRLISQPVFVAVAVASLTYSLYPLWMLASGDWAGFVEVKWLSLQRLLGMVQISGWNRPGVSLADFLLQRLADYGSSYLLLALAGVATLWLILRHRHERIGRLLGSWGVVLYTVHGFVALFGSGNDQFFYFLLVPAILLVGYPLATLPQGPGGLGRHRRILAATLLLVLLLPYNTARWWSAYGVGVDNGYRRLAAYVREHLPPNDLLNATGDALKFQYFFPERPIAQAATPEEAQAVGVRFFALAPKDVQARFGRTTPKLAAWITAQGQLLYSVYGDSYGQISLYRVDYEERGGSVSGATDAIAGWRTFQPAQGGFVGSLLLALGLWIGITGALAIWLNRRQLMAFARSLANEPKQAAQTLEAEGERA